MPYPPEYERAGSVFADFLVDVKNNADFGSSHMAYTMTQGVFMVFRRRLSLKDAIRFSNVLPAAIRALFVADWNVDEPTKEFSSRVEMNQEVGELRADHNFSALVEDPILCVARALRNYVDESRFEDLISVFPKGARSFWQIN